ncbi:MAG TPA: RluA family pseudouridine synthase [Blastocatellia bacterium]|nr:RluA family pseudouridine synthase [Blastocatellia bacterium]
MTDLKANDSYTEESARDACAPREELSFRVSDEQSGTRLDKLLAGLMPNQSRTLIQRLIENSDVLVNEKPVKSSYKVRVPDRIDVEVPPPLPLELKPESIPLNIVYEDDDLIVVDKPAGLIVHPGAGVSSGTLANGLVAHFNQLSGSAGVARPGIVHRIDKDTSGLLVVAKNDHAHQGLSEQFSSRTVFKRYVALSFGRFADNSGKVDAPIGRDPNHRTRMAVRKSGGRPALSLYTVRERFDEFTLLDVEIKTGRTHQIRVHLTYIKHPVVGDKTYGEGRENAIKDVAIRRAVASLDRQFLHAAELGFTHPRTDKPMRFHSSLASELERLLKLLRGVD